MRPAELVRRFYDELWNRADERMAEHILARDFRFRGSLGPETVGRQDFIAYLRNVHAALADYRCRIEDLIEAGDRVAARVEFSGVHRAEFFAVPPTGRRIAWTGAAFFTCSADQITALWVLGDIDSIKQQLGAGASQGFKEWRTT